MQGVSLYLGVGFCLIFCVVCHTLFFGYLESILGNSLQRAILTYRGLGLGLGLVFWVRFRDCSRENVHDG